jgi:hypothetical protein
VRFSTTVVFFILFVVVGGVYLYLNPKWGPDSTLPHEQVAAPPSVSLLGLAPGDSITWIQVQNLEKKETITLIREDGNWMLKFPVAYPAGSLMMDNMMKALETRTKIRPFIAEKGEKEFGLQNPLLKIGIQTEKNTDRRYLYLGGPSPMGDMTYARWEKEKEVFLVDGELKRAFSRSVYYLREKRIFRTSLTDISRIQLQVGTDVYEIQNKNNLWTWSLPVSEKGMTVDPAAMNEIMTKLNDLFVKDFLDNQKLENPELGLVASVNLIKIWGSKSQPETLYVGREVPTRHGFYARREGEKVPLLLDRDKISGIFSIITELTDNTVKLT